MNTIGYVNAIIIKRIVRNLTFSVGNMKILGLVNESNGYYNFKPLYELKNSELLELADHTIEDLEENRNSYGELNQTAYKLNAPKLID